MLYSLGDVVQLKIRKNKREVYREKETQKQATKVER